MSLNFPLYMETSMSRRHHTLSHLLRCILHISSMSETEVQISRYPACKRKAFMIGKCLWVGVTSLHSTKNSTGRMHLTLAAASTKAIPCSLWSPLLNPSGDQEMHGVLRVKTMLSNLHTFIQQTSDTGDWIPRTLGAWKSHEISASVMLIPCWAHQTFITSESWSVKVVFIMSMMFVELKKVVALLHPLKAPPNKWVKQKAE